MHIYLFTRIFINICIYLFIPLIICLITILIKFFYFLVEDISVINPKNYIIDNHSKYLLHNFNVNLENIITNKFLLQHIKDVSIKCIIVTNENNFDYYFLGENIFYNNDNNKEYYLISTISELLNSTNSILDTNIYSIFIKELNLLNHIYFRILEKNYKDYLKYNINRPLTKHVIWSVMYVAYLESNIDILIKTHSNNIVNHFNKSYFIEMNKNKYKF